MYLFENAENEKLGQVRIQITDESSAIIGISIDPSQRGKGYARTILEIASFDFGIRNSGVTINAYIKEGNMASVKGFEKAGFTLLQKTNYENIPSFHYIKK